MVKAITYLLDNNSGVQALVGMKSSGEGYKVYPVAIPSTEKAPYIAVSMVGMNRPARNCNFLFTFNITCYHTSYDNATELAEAILDAIEQQAPATINAEEFGFAILVNAADGFSKEHELYSKTLTFEASGA